MKLTITHKDISTVKSLSFGTFFLRDNRLYIKLHNSTEHNCLLIDNEGKLAKNTVMPDTWQVTPVEIEEISVIRKYL
jgi:hypothetical protein